MVISLKKFLDLDSDSGKTLIRVVRLLVDGIGRHAAAGDPADVERFRGNIVEVSESLADDIARDELLVRVGSVVQALEDQAVRTMRYQHQQRVELQNMVGMLAATVGAVSAATEASRHRLGEIERQVASASLLSDVLPIRARLADCLADIRKEAERQQKETGATIENLTQGLDEARKRSFNVVSGAVEDDITCLRGRPDAEAALAEPASPGSQNFAAVLVLERLQFVNGRFGKAVGDEVLAEFARLARKSLPDPDRLFRWGGPALVAVMNRSVPLERVRSEVARRLEAKWEYSIQTQSRGVLLPITRRWVVLPTMSVSRVLYRQIDAFVAANPSGK